MPLERMELWDKQFEIKEGLFRSPALLVSLPGGFLGVLQLPAFPNGRYVRWEGTLVAAKG